jgi:hypothetical protein
MTIALMGRHRFIISSVIILSIVIIFLSCGSSIASVSKEEKGQLTISSAGDLKIPYYRNYPIGTANDAIENAIIVIQGTTRKPDDYYQYMCEAAKKANKFNNSIIIAPFFMIKDDGPHDDELYWDDNNGWVQGDLSTKNHSSKISSYAVLDEILKDLAEPLNFPNLKRIAIVGHSAGGQFVQRFACGSREEQEIDIPVRYLVANPSSYLYLDGKRVVNGSLDRFAQPITKCKYYNKYKYGLAQLNSYMNSVGSSQIRKQYEFRDVFYLLGNLDNEPDAGYLDTSCAAMLEGNDRLERGIIYYNYLKYFYGSPHHQLIKVDNVGHDAELMFNSDKCIALLFF